MTRTAFNMGFGLHSDHRSWLRRGKSFSARGTAALLAHLLSVALLLTGIPVLALMTGSSPAQASAATGTGGGYTPVAGRLLDTVTGQGIAQVPSRPAHGTRSRSPAGSGSRPTRR